MLKNSSNICCMVICCLFHMRNGVLVNSDPKQARPLVPERERELSKETAPALGVCMYGKYIESYDDIYL